MLYTTKDLNMINLMIRTGIENAPVKEERKEGKPVNYSFYEISFDIETTKNITTEHSFMYVSQFSFGGQYGVEFDVIVRTWEDVFKIIDMISEHASNRGCTCIIWIANLSYEFSFMAKHFEPDSLKVMADSPRKPIFIDYKNVQFRDTLRVSGMNLRETAEKYCKTQKLELDYDIMRNNQTPLTDKEISYDINDTRICCEFYDYILNMCLKDDLKIPFTQTGILRQHVRKNYKVAIENGEIGDKYIRTLYPKKQEEYTDIMSFLYSGGDTHGKASLIDLVIGNTPDCDIICSGVQCNDFESSYPARMAQNDNYPVSPFVRLYPKNIYFLPENKNPKYTYWYDVTFSEIQAKMIHTYISKHKCKFLSDKNVIDNGKIYYAEKIRVYITEMDYECIKKLYKWGKIKINRTFTAKKGRLPEYLLKAVFNAGKTKAQLKLDGKSKTAEYATSKAMYNSGYGLCVQKLVLDEITYKDGIWTTENTTNYKDAIEQTMLSCYWGIWITSNARKELIDCIVNAEKVGSESAYNDTDSLYILNPELSTEWIEKYNEEKRDLNKKYFSADDLKYFINLGTLDKDPICCKFKTLGAKRYIKEYTDKEGLHRVATIAGLPKKSLNKYCDVNKKDMFEIFEPELLISEFLSGKLCSKYDDNEYTEIVVDHNMQAVEQTELSGVCLCEIPFQIMVDSKWFNWCGKINR